MQKHYTIPIFLPEIACLGKCIFCSQEKITTRSMPSEEQIILEIEKRLKTIPHKNTVIQIAFFGGSFTAMPLEMQEKYLSLVFPFIESKKIDSLRISTRPDAISLENLSLLKKYKVKNIELGIQSMDREVLSFAGRNSDLETIEKSVKMIQEQGFDLGAQMLIGLPYDTLEKALKTAEFFVSWKVKEVRIYPVLVIRGTKLANLYYEGKYQPLSLQQAIDWTKKLLLFFESYGITVIRVGLHPSDNLLSGNVLVVREPFHPSFRSLVMSALWKERFVFLSQKQGQIIEITVSSSQLSHAIGYRKENKIFLEQFFKQSIWKIDKNLKDSEWYYEIKS